MKNIFVLISLFFLITGCGSITITSALKIVGSINKSIKEIDAKEEYYIGRMVSANIIDKYELYKDEKANAYINKIGKLLTYVSDKPTTYGGYHFIILDSDEVNAFASPGGFVFVTRGLLKCAKSEDAVAAVLAHEISHIALEHGMDSIKQSRWTSTATAVAAESAKQAGSAEVANMTAALENTVSDIVNTLVVNGYSRTAEMSADRMTIKMLKRAGYNSYALIDMLKEMDKRLKPDGIDFAKTHPNPKERINQVKNDAIKITTAFNTRQNRFNAALKGI